jgi:hypothetical protein
MSRRIYLEILRSVACMFIDMDDIFNNQLVHRGLSVSLHNRLDFHIYIYIYKRAVRKVFIQICAIKNHGQPQVTT